MAHILIPENFKLGLYLETFFGKPEYLRFPQENWSGSDVLQKAAKIFLVLLFEGEKSVKSILLALDYYSNFVWPEATRNTPV